MLRWRAAARRLTSHVLCGSVGVALAACSPGKEGSSSETTGPTGTSSKTGTTTESTTGTGTTGETGTTGDTETTGGGICSPDAPVKGIYAEAPFGDGIVIDGDEACTPLRLFATGDVNGDGRSDVVLHREPGGLAVVFGASTPGHVDLAEVAAGEGGFVIEPGTQGDVEWRASGDVNGDGRLDLVARADAARTLVVFGVDATAPIVLDDVAAGVGGFAIEHGDMWPTQRVDDVADVSGDGLDDLIYGGFGTAHVLFGAAEPVPATLAEIGEGVGGFAEKAVYSCGPFRAVALGDVDGDGFRDFAATEVLDPNLCGEGPGTTDTTYVIRGRDGELLGSSRALVHSLYYAVVHGAGDVDGDGFTEVVIEGAGGPFSGTPILSSPTEGIIVYYGHPDVGELAVGLAAALEDFELDGWTPESFEVRGVADINSDGSADVVVAGGDETYVVFGAPPLSYEPVDDVVQDPYKLAPGITADVGVHLPRSGVLTLPDVDGDGIADLAFADPTAAAARGEVSLLFGRPDLSSGQAVDASLFGELEDDHLGAQVDAADVNGDGLADLIVTAPGAGSVMPGSGRVYVVFGAP